MKKVLIVDDEYYFRQGFKKMIPWGKYGYEIYAEAKNGQEALEIITNSKPDLIFLDINMPVINGIELMKNLYEREIKIPTVLLTGYGEFEYAKQAIKFGVKEYLLKPVETSAVCELLDRLSKQTSDNKDYINEPDSFTMGIIKDKLLMDLISGDFDLEKEKLFNQIAKISFSAKSYLIVMFRIAKSADWSQDDLRLWVYGVSNIIQELICESFCCELFSVAETDICGVLWEKDDKNNLEDSKLKEKCKEISKAVYDNLGIRACAGIGSKCSEVSQIKVSYSQAEEAVDSKLIFPGSVILYSDVILRSANISVFSMDEKRHLLTSLYLCDKDSIYRIVNAVFSRIKDLCASMAVVKNVISEFSSILSEAGQHIPNGSTQSGAELDLQIEMGQCETIDDICLLVEQIFLNTSERIMQSRPAMSTAQRTVDKIREYIEHEYRRPDLDEYKISKNMYLTRNYLCSIFKKVTGITIGKYIDAVRIEKAKELFKAGNTVIQTVSEKVGFCDPNYFGKFFKKQTGFTPSQYINTIK